MRWTDGQDNNAQREGRALALELRNLLRHFTSDAFLVSAHCFNFSITPGTSMMTWGICCSFICNRSSAPTNLKKY
jgi:hypothetical protein